MKFLRPLLIVIGFCLVWQAIVTAFALPRFILPAPLSVAAALIDRWDLLLLHARITLIEIVLGLAVGAGFGFASALTLAYWAPARRWLLPILVVSQAVPIFAIAPLLVLWLGYGLASKVAAAALIIYFPVTSAFYDGLRRTEPGYLDLAAVMGAGRWRVLTQIRVPAALPALASGLRVASVVAPIGAVFGEWVGASAGLGYLILQANARMQIDLLFAALVVLGAVAVTLYYLIDAGLRRLVPWQPETITAEA